MVIYSDHIEIFPSQVEMEMWEPPDCFEWGLKVIKEAASCKHRQAINAIQCEKSFLQFDLRSS